ncbi:hypothetical protein [Cellulomonas soli]
MVPTLSPTALAHDALTWWDQWGPSVAPLLGALLVALVVSRAIRRSADQSDETVEHAEDVWRDITLRHAAHVAERAERSAALKGLVQATSELLRATDNVLWATTQAVTAGRPLRSGDHEQSLRVQDEVHLVFRMARSTAGIYTGTAVVDAANRAEQWCSDVIDRVGSDPMNLELIDMQRTFLETEGDRELGRLVDLVRRELDIAGAPAQGRLVMPLAGR